MTDQNKPWWEEEPYRKWVEHPCGDSHPQCNILAIVSEARRRARAELLEKVIGIVENMTPQPDYPTAHNGYQRFTDEEEKENEILNKILSRLSLLNPPGETKV